MCFENSKTELDKYRQRKNPITVWKTGSINPDTGWVTTQFGKAKAVWIKGQVTHADKIRKPLTNGAYASCGLYFYTSEPKKGDYNQYYKVVVATVEPKDVIAANWHGDVICAIKATVIKAPMPNKKEITAKRIKFLQDNIQAANQSIRIKYETIINQNQSIEENQEALQQMIDELNQLKPKSRVKNSHKNL